MTQTKGEYRFSALAVMLFGVVGIVVGVALEVFAYGTGFGGLGLFLWLGGGVLLVIGAVRAVSERRMRQDLADRAANATLGRADDNRESAAYELDRITALHAAGSLSDDEFTAAKAKVLAS